MVGDTSDGLSGEVEAGPQAVLGAINILQHRLNQAKPNDRSGLDRRYAILITKVEDVYAYFRTYVDPED